MKLNENHILIGLGGTGGKVLKAFRKRLWTEFTPEEREKLPIAFVYVDSSVEMMKHDDKTWYVLGTNAQFDANEFVNIKGIALDAIFDQPSAYPGLQGFLGDPEIMKKTIGDVGEAAAQKRRVGRFLFGANVEKYRRALVTQLNKVQNISHAARTNIYIFTGLAGGTGSGSIIDVITQTRNMDVFRQTLSPDGRTGTGIVVNCMVPEITPPGTSDAGRYHANGYAALTELNALMVKRYHPCDVTGTRERIDFSGINKVCDGLVVYSNTNEHGVIVESLHELPTIVSDFTYSRIFLEQNDNTEEFKRSYSFENIESWRVENYEKAKTDIPEPYRAKTVSSFGIKRVIIPEEEIKDYFAYTWGREALLQIRYNNWNDDLGYRDTPLNIDAASLAADPQLLDKWHMTDKHLILDLPILRSDEKKWPLFAAYWHGSIARWADDARNDRMPLNKLTQACEKGYGSLFRNVGVKGFFEGKTASREDHAKEIVDLIETYLFDKWYTGDYSLYNLLQMIDAIIAQTANRRKLFEEREAKVNKMVEALTHEATADAQDFATSLFRGFTKSSRVEKHSTILEKLYVRRTEAEGITFAISLLSVLNTKLSELRSRIEKFVDTINGAITYSEAMIGSRCQDRVDIDSLEGTVIRFYDQPEVATFAKRVSLDKARQNKISNNVRETIVKRLGNEKTFRQANAVFNQEEIETLIENVVRTQVITIHDELLIENNEKIINRSILEQLAERYPDEESRRRFAHRVVTESGVFMEFNNAELGKSVPNNNPAQLGLNVHRRIVLVQLPKVEGNDQVTAYAEKLKAALIGAVEAGIEVKVDMNGTRKNEMTVMSIAYCFPLRCIRNLQFLKEKYDYLANNPATGREARIVLHTEGDGTQFPSLFVAADKPMSQLRKDYYPYVILGTVMGLVKYADLADGTGRQAYGTVTTDDLGLEVLVPYADKFTEIGLNHQLFTETFGEEMKERVEALFKNEYLNVAKRQAELVPKIQTLIKEVILPECNGNQGSEKFLEFRQYALAALALLK